MLGLTLNSSILEWYKFVRNGSALLHYMTCWFNRKTLMSKELPAVFSIAHSYSYVYYNSNS